MLKFLLITFLVGYLVYKVGGYLFRIFFWSLGNKMQNSQNFDRSQPQSPRPPNSNVDIDYIPKNGKEEKGKTFKGGEYVDYEEIKEK